MTRLRVALIGAGSIGTNHARVIAGSDRAQLTTVVDVDPDRARALADRHEAANATELDSAMGCDAAVIATETASHVALGGQLMEAGVPVFIEKPIAEDPEEVADLIALSNKVGLPMTCGFVERFNPAVTTALSLLAETPRHVVALRHSPPAPRVAVSVLHDLSIHDLDLSIRLCGDDIRSVFAVAWRPEGNETPEAVDATVRFTSGAVANLSADRWSQHKIRALFISTERSLIELDLVRQDITVYRHVRHEIDDTTYRAETVVDIPFIRQSGEPLALQFDHFLDLVTGAADPDVERAGLLAPHQLAAQVQRAIDDSDR